MSDPEFVYIPPTKEEIAKCDQENYAGLTPLNKAKRELDHCIDMAMVSHMQRQYRSTKYWLVKAWIQTRIIIKIKAGL